MNNVILFADSPKPTLDFNPLLNTLGQYLTPIVTVIASIFAIFFLYRLIKSAIKMNTAKDHAEKRDELIHILWGVGGLLLMGAAIILFNVFLPIAGIQPIPEGGSN